MSNTQRRSPIEQRAFNAGYMDAIQRNNHGFRFVAGLIGYMPFYKEGWRIGQSHNK